MTVHSYDIYSRDNPCSNCPSPCCQIQLHPYQAPANFKDLDIVRYRLLFPGTELIFSRTDEWYLLHWKKCTLFREDTYSCSAQGSDEKPQICSYFNQYDCWFKQNFVAEIDKAIVRLDQRRFERWLKDVKVDETGRVVSLPLFGETCKIVSGMPIAPTFSLLLPGSVTKIRRVKQQER